MARFERLESRGSLRIVAGSVSVMLHAGILLLIAFAGGRQDGVDSSDVPATQLVMLESPRANRQDGPPLAPPYPATPTIEIHGKLEVPTIAPPTPPLVDADPPPDERDIAPPVESSHASDTVPTAVFDEPSTFVMPQSQASALLQRIEHLAVQMRNEPRLQSSWTEDGKRYDAELVLARASNGHELDHVIADVSAEDRGRQLRTRVLLKRLAFSHFAQLVDQWDPMVQLHDDEIVGRTHINSRFKVLADTQARPTLLGKVSTAAGRFDLESVGRRRESDVFPEGIETRAGRISLSAQVKPPAEWARHDVDARIHELREDTRIRFFANGGYWWRDSKSAASQYRDDRSRQPVYFIAAPGVTLYVQGVVTGKILVYSPQAIVVEGSLTYAHDPRDVPDSEDYLGLVSDRDIEVAPARITGPGDLHINAALFARRRFVVTDIDHSGGSATLRIYGSLAAGSLTASEPRYATRLEFDERFEQTRPPGFPSTNRFAAMKWDRQWMEEPEDFGNTHTALAEGAGTAE